MINIDVIVTGIIGIITSIISAWTSWFFARKKYNSEVDSNLIRNMQESLEFYKKLSDDNRERLEDVLKRNEELEREVKKLNERFLNIMTTICVDLSCQVRKRDFKLFNIDGTSSRQKVEKAELHDK
jgi:hypothetical protein